MRKPKIYLETTVFNRMVENDRKYCEETKRLFAEIADGKFEAYASAYVYAELMNAEWPKRDEMLALLTHPNISFIEVSAEAELLAKEYTTHGILSEKHYYDRIHLACASVNGLDAIISYNFSHINRLKTKTLLPHVNQLNGYGNIAICVPMEVIGDDE